MAPVPVAQASSSKAMAAAPRRTRAYSAVACAPTGGRGTLTSWGTGSGSWRTPRCQGAVGRRRPGRAPARIGTIVSTTSRATSNRRGGSSRTGRARARSSARLGAGRGHQRRGGRPAGSPSPSEMRAQNGDQRTGDGIDGVDVGDGVSQQRPVGGAAQATRAARHGSGAHGVAAPIAAPTGRPPAAPMARRSTRSGSVDAGSGRAARHAADGRTAGPIGAAVRVPGGRARQHEGTGQHAEQGHRTDRTSVHPAPAGEIEGRAGGEARPSAGEATRNPPWPGSRTAATAVNRRPGRRR